MKHYIDNYLNETELSSNTKKSYRQRLYLYYEWLKEKEKDMTKVDNIDIKNFLYKYKKPRSYNAMIVTLSLFYGWLKRNGMVISDYTKDIQLKKIDKTIPDPLKDNEIEILLNTTKDINLRMPILLMLYAGLRATEAISLRKKDFYKENNNTMMIKLKGKGNKERETYIYKKDAQYELESYLDTLNLGQKITNVTLSVIEKYAILLKEKIQNFHLHRLRKTFACSLADLGVKPEQIMLLLGHNDIKTTFLYTKYRLNRQELIVR